MASEPLSDTNIDEVSSKLQGGLQTCRSVIANYRSLLSQSETPDAMAADNDDAEQGGSIEG